MPLACTKETGDNRLMRALACAVALLVVAAPAHADVLTLFGEAHGGGMGGKGMGGDQKDEAFFPNAPHGMYGLKVSARFLVLEGHIQHHQYRGGGSLATWTQFSVGIGFGVDLGDEKQKKEHKSTFVEISALLGGGLGTGRQVDPPLSNDEITDKGGLFEGRFSLGKHLSKFFDVGVAFTGSYGYFLKNGVDDTANDVTTHYTSMQFEALGYLRLRLKLL
jgi:hypothetical protein